MDFSILNSKTDFSTEKERWIRAIGKKFFEILVLKEKENETETKTEKYIRFKEQLKKSDMEDIADIYIIFEDTAKKHAYEEELCMFCLATTANNHYEEIENEMYRFASCSKCGDLKQKQPI